MSDRDNYDTRFDYKYPTSSKTSPNRKQEDYDGVEYIPSGRAPQRTGGPRPPAQRKTSARPGSAPRTSGTRGSYGGGNTGKKRMRSQSQSAVFMAIIVSVGVLLCLGAFLLMFNLMKPNTVKTTDPAESAAASNGDISDADTPAIIESDAEMTGAISSISNGTVSILNYETDRIEEIFVNTDTSYRNKYGQAMTLAQFGDGDIVIAEYSSTNKKAQMLRLDPEGWSKPSVKNIEINPETTTVKAGNDTLSISPGALFLPDGTDSVVKQSDVVTLKGRKSKVMAVIVEKRSGSIEFRNKDKISDGTVEVDSDIYKALEETGTLKVPTGEHTVVVKGSNIDAFIKEINVKEGETVIIDLEEAQVKEGIVSLIVNEADYLLYVNDELIVSSQEPLKLPFGAYKLKVTKEGFTAWEGTVTVNQPNVSVNAMLTAEVKMGKITVTTVPDGVPGSVYIDNALIGTAPIYRANITYGTHQLTVKAPGYEDTSTPIIVEGDSTYNVIMHPASNSTNNTGSTGADINNINNAGSTGDVDNLGADFVDPAVQ